MAELPQVHGISIIGMNLNCLYAAPKDWTQVAAVLGEAANHYTNDAGVYNIYIPVVTLSSDICPHLYHVLKCFLRKHQ